MKFDENSITQQSLILGKSRNYVYGIRARNKPLYEYILEAGNGDFVLGYYTYIDLVESVREEFLKCYNIIESVRLVSEFTKRYEYGDSTIAHLGTRMLKFNTSFKLYSRLKGINRDLKKFILVKGLV